MLVRGVTPEPLHHRIVNETAMFFVALGRKVDRKAKQRLLALTTGLCLTISFSLTAQQPQVHSQFFINPYVYNPAMAGVEGHTALFMIYRHQWVGINEAPRVAHVNWHVPLKLGFAIGSQFSNDRIGPLTDNSFKFTTAYLLNLDRTHFFRFGLSLGGGARAVIFNQLTEDAGLYAQRNATYLRGYLENTAYFLADAGMMYHFGKFNIGMSVPDLLVRNTLNQQTLTPVKSKPLDNIFFKVNYRQPMFNDAIALEPHALYRFSNIGASQWEGVMILHIKHTVWVGASYRQDAGGNALAGFKVAESFVLGYAYELPFASDLNPYTTGTHEIHLGIHVGARKRHTKHAHSFIKSHAKSREERLAEKAAREAEAAKMLEEELKRLAGKKDVSALPTEEAEVVPDTGGEEKEDEYYSGVQADKDQQLQVEGENETWSPEPETDGKPVVRNFAGKKEEALKLVSEDQLKGKKYALGWIPVSNAQKRKIWSVREDVPLVKRRNAEGRDELVAVWNVRDEQGRQTQQNLIFPIYNADELEQVIAESGGVKVKKIPFYLSNQVKPDLYNNDNAVPLGTMVRQGNHLLELPAGSFVVVGSFRTHENAQRYSEYLLARGYIASVGYSSDRNYFYVDLFASNDLSKARAERDRLRQNPLFKNAWVLTVISN